MEEKEVKYCPECNTILIEKPELRSAGIVEMVEYCYGCGYTATSL